MTDPERASSLIETAYGRTRTRGGPVVLLAARRAHHGRDTWDGFSIGVLVGVAVACVAFVVGGIGR